MSIVQLLRSALYWDASNNNELGDKGLENCATWVAFTESIHLLHSSRTNFQIHCSSITKPPPITSDPLLLSDPNSPFGERQSCGGDGTNPGIHGYSRYFLIRGSPILPGGVLEIQFQRSAKDENETLLSRKCWGYVNFLDGSRLELKKTSFVYAARRHCSLPAAASGLRTSTFLFLRTEPSFLQTLILLYISLRPIGMAE